jgi:formate hydrogenlyase subunit 3/multisubunit Na+/H+ antiporter MnhD subunit
MIAGPWVLVGVPLVVAPLVYLVRRWAFLGALFSGGTATALAWLCFVASPSEPVTLFGQSLLLGQPVAMLGRELALTPAGQRAIGFLFAIAGVSFLLAWPVSPGRSFFPLGLALLGGWAAAILMRHFAFAVILFWLVSTLATMVIQGGQVTSTRGAGRQMLVLTLAVPLLLLVSTWIEMRAVNPDDFVHTRPAILLTATGLAALFAAFPFEGWVPAMVTGAQPGVVAFLVCGYQVVVLLVTLDLFHNQPWLVANGQVLSLLAWGGLLAAAIGGGLAAVQRHLASLLGYTVMNDLGVGLIALVLADETGLIIVFLMAATRAVGLLLAGAGLAVIRQRAAGTSFVKVIGLGRRLPLATAGLLIGGLSLSGFPLTAGFAARWALLKHVSPAGGPWMWGPLIASLGALIGWLRGAQALLTSTDDASPIRRTPLIAGILIIALIAICLWLGHRPNWLLLWLRPLVDAYAPLIVTPTS